MTQDEVLFERLKNVLESPRIARLVEELRNSLASSSSERKGKKKEGGLAPSSPPNSLRLFDDVYATCRQCSSRGGEANARGFVQGPPLSVVLCSNRLHDKDQVEEVLLHELIHLYDLKVKKLDFSRCSELAYSEVRSNRESECEFSTIALLSSACQ